MLVSGKSYRTIWLKPDDESVVQIIDQVKLPWRFEIVDLRTVNDAATAIRDMWVRGAGLIGATAGYGMYLAALEAGRAADFRASLEASARLLIQTRPTAVNLAWAVNRQLAALRGCPAADDAVKVAKEMACIIANEDAAACRSIGQHGLGLIRQIAANKKGGRVNVLTHCNAGWLAFVDHGSATSPVYAAHDSGIPVHVWVDETRPRNQGARLTAWELAQHGVPHTVIADNTGGHLMQHGMVDLVITGADRVTRCGDVANKIGTYLKALAARDNDVPFYVALPSSTLDWSLRDGVREIPIEQRDAAEVTHMEGILEDGGVRDMRIIPPASPAANYAFDVTPARLVTGLITERGICAATEEGLLGLYPERA
ncbi:MAG: S-methyl-5-thioribose-1-phosphate isomerase [Verrucomicrobiaceae bacterium]|nr:S-methyl-5-thioribose-1-phosphate isomerase [Verrucomicrobiaceae bacterium]